ncbi:BTAD domain-containing putative transcriptional regulator [Saccharothrix sp. Mg75]|uniref:BTAD domain-containing putative transcriptional regulator n=1 Tax=Saccharothrix sp. Mg75 TaxID=3445357 RepID=UPI003EEE11AE
MRIRVLGQLEVLGPDGAPTALGGTMLRTLLLRLVVDVGRVVTTDRLVADLWPGDEPADPVAALQSLVARLRRALGRDAIGSHPAGYRLDVPPDEVDAEVFARAAAEGRPRDALALWRGEPFADAGDAAFTTAPAARLAGLRASAVEARIDLDLAAGPTPALIAEIEELITAAPLREALHARLVRAHTALGHRADALAAHERARSALADQLGADPGRELRDAHLHALRATAARSTLPARLTSFVGRERELEQVVAALGPARLVTITGTGGAGKTRLAVEAAERLRDGVPDGVWLVDLVPVTSGEGVTAAVRAAVDTADDPRDFLADRAALLLLDNCEHLLDDIAGFTADLLARCPRLRVLATSREPLGITGETLRPLAPLAEDPAVALFTDRARAVRPGFTADASTADVCRALDGLPLAIELAAARLRSLTPDQLVRRLGDRLGLLDRGVRAAPARHRTLRAVLDWSWDLLDEPGRALLAALSVFAGGATADAVEDVTGASLDELSSLVDKSLVVEVDGRYRLLETVREYAAGKPGVVPGGESGVVPDRGHEVRRRHAAHYADLAERAEPLLRGPAQEVWGERLTAEGANLDLAMSRPPFATRLFAARLWYWLVRGRLDEARRWAARVDGDLARALTDPTPGLLDDLARRDEPAALLAACVGDHTDHARLTAIADRLTASTDAWRRAAGELVHGYAASEISEGGGARAERHYAAAARGFREVGDHTGLACSLMFLSTLQANRGDVLAALGSVSEATRHVPAASAIMRAQTAQLRARTGDLDGARAVLERAEREAVRDDDPLALARVHNGLAEVARLAGDTATALRRHHLALAVDPAAASPQFLAMAHDNHARTLTALGDLDAAGEQHALAVEHAHRAPDGPVRATALEGRAAWCAATGDQEGALALLDLARRARGTDNPALRAEITGSSAPGTARRPPPGR